MQSDVCGLCEMRGVCVWVCMEVCVWKFVWDGGDEKKSEKELEMDRGTAARRLLPCQLCRKTRVGWGVEDVRACTLYTNRARLVALAPSLAGRATSSRFLSWPLP